MLGIQTIPASALAVKGGQPPLAGKPLDSLDLAEIDSQYGILEAERQQLSRLAAQTALEQARMARWAREYDLPPQTTTYQLATYARAREALVVRAEVLSAQARELASFVEKAISATDEKQKPVPADFQVRRGEAPSVGPFAALKGELPWPARGSISSAFGVRRNAVFGTDTENPGIDLSINAVSPVTAVAEGTVANLAWLRGYGNVCIVDHPNQHHTVYARLQDVQVKKGQVVGAGSILGTTEFDSLSNSFALHFEVWAGKEKQDPLKWLAPAKN